jgi:hypothetical protein
MHLSQCPWLHHLFVMGSNQWQHPFVTIPELLVLAPEQGSLGLA